MNISEKEVIKKFFRPLAINNSASLALNDDVAIIPKDAHANYVITTDSIVMGVHFFPESDARVIARRLMLSNLSDIASSGGKPLFYSLNGVMNKYINEEWLAEFTNELQLIQEEYNITLIGGDTVKCDELILSATIIGEVARGKNLARNNAKIGDDIYITNNIGAAGLGLNLLHKKYYGQYCEDVESTITIKNHLDRTNNNEQINAAIESYQKPTAQIDVGQALVENNLSKCACDISDGLLADLENICLTSNVAANIYLDLVAFAFPVPIQDDNIDILLYQLSGGDDYQLLFTSSQDNRLRIQELASGNNYKLTRIGEIIAGTEKTAKRINLYDDNSNKNIINYDKKGYEHVI